MFTKKKHNEGVLAEILLSGQSLSFKLNKEETVELINNLEEAAYDFKQMKSIILYYTDGRLKSLINPLEISRIWFS